MSNFSANSREEIERIQLAEIKKLLAASTNAMALLIMSFNSPYRSTDKHYELSPS